MDAKSLLENSIPRASGQQGAAATGKYSVAGLAAIITTHGCKGVNWQADLSYSPVRIEKGKSYEASFTVRSDVPMPAWIWTTQAEKPWRNVGLSQPFEITTEFKTIRFKFCGTQTEENARMVFPLGEKDNVIYFRDVTLLEESVGRFL